MSQLQPGKLFTIEALLQHFVGSCFSTLLANINIQRHVSVRQHCQKCNRIVAKPAYIPPRDTSRKAYIPPRGWRNCMVDVAEIVMN